MKQNKGKQVFTGDTDSILAEKIIKHTQENSRDIFSPQPEHQGIKHPYFAKKCITILLTILCSSALILFLISRVNNKSNN